MYLDHVFHDAHPTSCGSSSKQLSKALAIALMVACAVAFMPLLNGQAFAAAKKPKKAKITSFVQNDTMTAEGYTVTGKWKAAKNAKKYKVIIKEDGTAVLTKTVSKKTKSISYAKAQIGKKYTLSVQSLNGKKKAKTATKNLTVVDKRAELKGIVLTYSGECVVGQTVTAAISEPANVTYTWTRGSAVVATGAEYTFAAADVGSKLKVTAVVDAADPSYKGEVSAETAVVAEPPKGDFFAETTPAIVGWESDVAYNSASDIDWGKATDYQWYVDGKKVAGATHSYYTPTLADAGKTLTCEVTYYLKGESEAKTTTVDFGKVAKDIDTDYSYLTLTVDGKVWNTAADVPTGKTVVAGLYKNEQTAGVAPTAADKYAGTSTVTYTWSWTYKVLENGRIVTKEAKETGESFAIDASNKADIDGIRVEAKVTPGADNYAGAVDPVTFNTAADSAKEIIITGDATFGNELTATVTGELGPITPTDVVWKKVGAEGNLGTGATYVVGDGLAAGDYVQAVYNGVASDAKKVSKATIASVTIDKANASVDLSGLKYTIKDAAGNEVGVGTAGYNTVATESVKITEGNAPEDVYAETAAEPTAIVEGNAYGVTVDFDENTWFNAATKVQATPVVAGAALKNFGAMTVKNQDGDVVDTAVLDDVLTPTILPQGVKATYHWCLSKASYDVDTDASKIKRDEVTTGASYTITEADRTSGLALYVYATNEAYNDSPITKITIDKRIKMTGVEVSYDKLAVDGKATISGVPTGYNVVWAVTTNGTSAVGDATQSLAPTATYTIPAAAYGGELYAFVVAASSTDYVEAANVPEWAPVGGNKVYNFTQVGTVKAGTLSVELVCRTATGTPAGETPSPTMYDGDTLGLKIGDTIITGSNASANGIGLDENNRPHVEWYVGSEKITVDNGYNVTCVLGTETSDTKGDIYAVIYPSAAYGGDDEDCVYFTTNVAKYTEVTEDDGTKTNTWKLATPNN